MIEPFGFEQTWKYRDKHLKSDTKIRESVFLDYDRFLCNRFCSEKGECCPSQDSS